MPEKKRVNINDMPKWFKAILILAPIAGLLLITTELDGDFYFIYKTGEYVLANGFPTTDFLSMHSGMHIIAQQWLSAVIYYFLYSRLGKIGAIGLVYICYGLFCTVMYKLTRLITDNFFVAAVFSFAADLLAAMMFEKTRPQAITMLLIVLALYMLESFVKKDKIIYLCVLPLISLALINLHAAMWAMLFVFAAPYAAAAIPFKFGKIKQEPCCSFVKLLICGIICFAVGFINPYGFEAMSYILTSFGQKYINGLIVEMQSPSLADAWGAVLFSSIAVMMCLAVFTKKKAFTTRFVLLFLGTTFMAMMNAKSIAYFIVGAIPAFTYLIKDTSIDLTIDEGKRSSKDKSKLTVLVLLFVAMLGVLGATLAHQSADANSYEKQNQSEHDSLDEIISILDKENKDDIVLFVGFNDGQYFEFYDYHPYIDGRAELFLKDNNDEFDYLKEYVELINGKLYYKDFINKYGFNYIVVDGESYHLLSNLKHDEDFELIYESETENLFKLKD